MTAEQWQEIERLFAAASELPPVDRARFLDEACAGQAAVRAEVDSLLEASGEGERFLDQPPSQLVANLFETGPASATVIGPYRILRLVGEGGMGTVYEAEQQNPQRTGGLKVIRRKDGDRPERAAL